MPVVQTVLGNIDPNLLGRTLTHEHLRMNFDKAFTPGPVEYEDFLKKKVTLDNLGYIRLNPLSSRDNLRFNDDESAEAVLKDVNLYKKFGGGSIVDNSSHGLMRDLEFLVDVSKKTGLNVIAGTGHYSHEWQPAETLNMKVEQMTDIYTKDIVTGEEVENIGMIKCGLIGEVGTGYPLHDFEKRAIRATGEVQEVLGCAVSIRPGSGDKAPFEVMRLYLEAGGRANKCALSHLDSTIFDLDTLLEFAKFGSYMHYDFSGTEQSYLISPSEPNIPSDAQRINNLLKLVSEGHTDRILMSNGTFCKIMLTSFGGYGYHNVHMNILPKLFECGLTVEEVERITVANPAEYLKLEI